MKYYLLFVFYVFTVVGWLFFYFYKIYIKKKVENKMINGLRMKENFDVLLFDFINLFIL